MEAISSNAQLALVSANINKVSVFDPFQINELGCVQWDSNSLQFNSNSVPNSNIGKVHD